MPSCYTVLVPYAPRLLLREILQRRDMSPTLLAQSCRLPRRVVYDLLQDMPPRGVRLAVLGVVAHVLDVHPRDLIGDADVSLTASLSVSDGPSYQDVLDQVDNLRDLEDAWAADFPDLARRDSDARQRWPFLYED